MYKIDKNNKKVDCELCNLTLENEKCFRDHCLGRKHQKALARFREIEGSIFVKGYHPSTKKEDLINYFSQFGGIEKTIHGRNNSYAIITYHEIEVVNNVLKKTHFLKGSKLYIEKRKPPPPRTYDRSAEKSDEKLETQKLNNFLTFKEQLKELISQLTPDPKIMAHKYDKVMTDMLECMIENFHECLVYKFGSSVTGLEFKSSDIDIYVKIFGRMTDNDTPYLNLSKKAFTRSSIFKNAFVISGAKIPIIKCVHVSTGLFCDINFRNKLGVCNSKLLRYYLHLHPTVKETMFVLKYWAKTNEITGQNHLFSSYSLTLMFIFYLQQAPFHFPSIYMLQQNVSKDEDEMWNGNFKEEPISSDNIIQNTSHLQLLKGFFEFYAEFPYETHMICPYLGKPLEKKIFASINSVPVEFELYHKYFGDVGFENLKYDKQVVLQDPFELNRNCCSIVLLHLLHKYKAYCKFAYDLIAKSDEQSLLVKLLTEHPQIKMQKTINVKKSPEKYQITLPLFEDPNEVIDLENWFNEITTFVLSLWEKIFKCTIEENQQENETNYGKNMKLDAQTDIHDCSQTKVYRAMVKMNLWDGRKIAEKYLRMQNELCEKKLKSDIAISDYLFDSNQKYASGSPIIVFDIFFYLIKGQEKKIVVEFVLVKAHTKCYKSLMFFFNSRFPLCLEL